MLSDHRFRALSRSTGAGPTIGSLYAFFFRPTKGR